jgi:hypothetical protein
MIKKVMVLACVAVAGTMGAAGAADQAWEGPKVAFDATYTSTGPAGPSTVRMISDGKGHMRTESSANGQKFVSIMDYPGKQTITLMEAQKMAMKMPLKTTGQDVHDNETAKKMNAKSLGKKVVNGHPSSGWKYQVDGGATVEVWTGDDINYMTKQETITPQGKMTMDLKSWSSAAPGPDAFKIPPGYKMMAMPGQ